MVLAGSFEWRQSEEDVCVEVPLKGCAVSEVDVYVSSLYVKINYKPYLVNLDLLHAVDEENALVEITGNKLSVRLAKLEKQEWKSLCVDGADKKELKERRLSSMEAKQERAQALKNTLAAKKAQDEKESTRAQMRVDEQERQRLESLKREEKQQAEEEVYKAFDKLPQQPVETKENLGIFPEEEDSDLALEKVLPKPRQSARIVCTFTPRVFNTPLRESKQEEEEDWLLRNRRHLKGKQRAKLDAVDIGDRDPYWLKGKGDDFYQSGSLESAVNAYSCALEIDPNMFACLSNRAACLLKMKQFERCIEDCTLALELIDKDTQQEMQLAKEQGFSEPYKETFRKKEMKKKLHMRKGSAYKELKQLPEALLEFQRAAEMDPSNGDLQADCTRLTLLVQSAAFKDQGDSLFRSKDYAGALRFYNKSIELDSETVAAFVNRSACHLKLGQVDEMIGDCQRALDLLEAFGYGASKCLRCVDAANATKNTQDAVAPSTSALSKNEDNLVLEEAKLRSKLLARIAGAHFDREKMEDATQFYRQALDLDPLNVELARNVKRVETLNA